MKTNSKYHITTLIGLMCLLFFSSCGGYYKHVMFKTNQKIDPSIQKSFLTIQQGYKLQAYDKFSFNIFTNKGELILDPNFQFSKSLEINNQQQNQGSTITYEIKPNGEALLPIIGYTNVVGYTIVQLDSLLAIAYEESSYKDVMISSKLENSRVTVLGGKNGTGTVIPLDNNNMSLIEVLALYGGIEKFNKSEDIKIIRGDLKNPDIQIVDLSTYEGLKKANTSIQPNDIIYIEPVKRILPESLSEASPILGFFTSVATLVFLITR
ncbi:MAG: polysaccharide biosynthesis/export family protein [Cyclobacteriaceae bacterium]